MDSIIKTEVVLSEEMVSKIIAAETSKVMFRVPEFMENMVKQILFTRPKKEYSSDKDKPTMYESMVLKYIQPIIEDEIKKIAEEWKPNLHIILKKAFKANVIDSKEFEERLIKKLSKFASNIDFYVSDNK